MEENEYAVVKVLRANHNNAESTFEEYRFPFDEGKNVLQVLMEIYENTDRSLSFRYYRCNRGVCGSCTMVINGKLKRACITKMTREMTIEPAANYRVIKDLVVDFKVHKVQGTG